MRALTIGQCAKLCNIAPRTVSKWFDAGLLKGFRVPNSTHRRVPQEHLLKFMMEHGMPIPDELKAADQEANLPLDPNRPRGT
jgi:DNA-binding transcriptional MerR regulator